MDHIPLRQMILRLVVLDDTPYLGKDPNHAFSPADLAAWEKAHGRVPKGAFAALRTDMYKDWTADPERFKRNPFPAWSPKRSSSWSNSAASPPSATNRWTPTSPTKMESETYILQHGRYQIEVMANLDQVPATGALIVVAWPRFGRSRIPGARLRDPAVKP